MKYKTLCKKLNDALIDFETPKNHIYHESSKGQPIEKCSFNIKLLNGAISVLYCQYNGCLYLNKTPIKLPSIKNGEDFLVELLNHIESKCSMGKNILTSANKHIFNFYQEYVNVCKNGSTIEKLMGEINNQHLGDFNLKVVLRAMTDHLKFKLQKCLSISDMNKLISDFNYQFTTLVMPCIDPDDHILSHRMYIEVYLNDMKRLLTPIETISKNTKFISIGNFFPFIEEYTVFELVKKIKNEIPKKLEESSGNIPVVYIIFQL